MCECCGYDVGCGDGQGVADDGLGIGDGDCDSSSDCQAGLLCGDNNCALFRDGAGWPWDNNQGWDASDDCCYSAPCEQGWAEAEGRCFRAFAKGGTTPSLAAFDSACRGARGGATLAKIESAAQNSAAAALPGSSSDYGIGLYYNASSSSYKWYGDGAPLGSYEASWHSKAQNECVRLIGAAHHWKPGQWDDFDCGQLDGYICSYDVAG